MPETDNKPKGEIIAGPWERPKQSPPGGDGTDDPPDMSRIARLEAHVEHAQADVTEIKSDLKTILARLVELPTRANLHTYTLTGIALGFAIMAVVIGGIIGGVSFIATKQGAPQVILMPAPQLPSPQK